MSNEEKEEANSLSETSAIDTTEPSRAFLSYAYDDDGDEKKEARKKKLIYSGIVLLILIGIGIFILV